MILYWNKTSNQTFEKIMTEHEYMKLDMTKNLAVLLMEENASLTMEQALSIVLNSDTYLRLQREETRLFYQSPRYVYAFLQTELKTGKIG